MTPSAATFATLLLIAACATGRGSRRVEATVERLVVAMGTTLHLEVVHADRGAALRASEAAVRAVEAVEARLSTWRADSELARLNAAPAGVPFSISRALEEDLRRADLLCTTTGGAFDPGVGRLVEIWGLRTGGRRPATGAVDAAMAGSGLRHLVLGEGTATRRHPELLLEEGGFGKGVGLDAAAAALLAAGVHGAVLDLGGQVLVVGAVKRAIGVADPRDRGRILCHVLIDGGSLATTGNSERAVDVGGRPVGHVLDPRTGYPAPDFGSVTVWAPDAFTADCLSTGLFVMGPEQALGWAEQRASVEAIIIELLPGGPPRVRATSGLRGRVIPPSILVSESPHRSSLQ